MQGMRLLLPGSLVQFKKMQSISDHDVNSLGQALAHNGHRAASALRVLREYWAADGEVEIDRLDLAKPAQQWLGQAMRVRHSSIAHRHQSSDGTQKLLVGFIDGGAAECVLMPSHRPDRAAVCISSQVGCAMGCDFCASGKSGLERDLGTGEIVEQFLHLRALAWKSDRRIASLVFMGMGEPMHNLENVIRAIRLLGEPGLGSLGFRTMTVSTVGIVPGIERLAKENLGVHLALSLHAPDDETRNKLVPSNRRWPVAAIMEAAKEFQDRTRRLVNVEYCLLADVNDSNEQAALLAQLMHGFRAHVNLIPYNSTGGKYRRPAPEKTDRFLMNLRDRGVVCHIRQTRGDDISAACGQLRVLRDQPQTVTVG